MSQTRNSDTPNISTHPFPLILFTSTAGILNPHRINQKVKIRAMANPILSFLGLQAASGQPANYAPAFLLANWFFAYCNLSPRFAKIAAGIDHNSSPREDLDKYGDAAVQAGKLSRRRLGQMKRMRSAHENSVEGFTFFVAAGMFYSLSPVD